MFLSSKPTLCELASQKSEKRLKQGEFKSKTNPTSMQTRCSSVPSSQLRVPLQVHIMYLSQFNEDKGFTKP